MRARLRTSASRAAGIQPVARYDAAGNGRRMAGWNAPASGPNRAIEGSATVRNRARDAARNEWAAVAALRIDTSSLIGTGIIARSKADDPERKKRHTALWDAWCAVSDADGQHDFYGLQALAVRAWLVSGEVFVRLRPRLPQDGLPVSLQIQIVESDLVPMMDAETWPGMPAGNVMRQGIELDRIGRRVAYWMYRGHPGERTGIPNASELVRVPAQFVLHMYQPPRPGQLRGVSEFSAILAKLRSVTNFDDATLHRQEIANLFAMIVIRQAAPMTTREKTSPTVQSPVATMMPGATIELDSGQDVKFPQPPGAGADYAAFMRQQHLGIAAGAGVPYELLTGDLNNISDRTLRVIINEYRRYCEQRQWQVIIPMFCRPVRAAWAAAALIDRKISADEMDDAANVTWSPQRWQYMHPVQDVTAVRAEIDAGIRSRGSAIAERGDDPDEVDRERCEDQRREIESGLRYPAPDPNQPSPVATAQARLLMAETALREAEASAARQIASATTERENAAAAAAHQQDRLAQAQIDLVNAQISEAEARKTCIAAEGARMHATSELNNALAQKESAARVASLQQQADDARAAENAARQVQAAATASAEAHAENLRILAREEAGVRLKIAQLDLEAARVGLAELQAGG